MDGQKIKGIIKEPYGLQMEKTSWEDNILEIGKKIKRKEEAPCFLKMVIDMMGFGLMINLMDKEEWFMQMEMFIKECGLWEKEADMEF